MAASPPKVFESSAPSPKGPQFTIVSLTLVAYPQAREPGRQKSLLNGSEEVSGICIENSASCQLSISDTPIRVNVSHARFPVLIKLAIRAAATLHRSFLIHEA